MPSLRKRVNQLETAALHMPADYIAPLAVELVRELWRERQAICSVLEVDEHGKPYPETQA